MAAAPMLARHPENRSDQLQQLRRQMAAISGKVGPRWHGQDRSAEVLPASESLLEVPDSLAGLLGHRLPKGSVAVLSGARSPVVGLTAAVSGAGGHVAVVGLPDFGLLAAAEMGADLSRLAVIPDPGADPVEVAAVLMDGMDLVVLGLGGRRVPPTRARAVVARARQRGCTLLITGGPDQWQGTAMRIEARVCGYDFTGAADGTGGRISGVRVSVRLL